MLPTRKKFHRFQLVHAVLLDFAKAFDTVSHAKLLHKAEAYGIGGEILAWLKSFLSNRTQRVRVDGCLSAESPVSSGVPQGTVLGPLLFLLYVNDLPECVHNGCKFCLFADDAKIYTVCDKNIVTDPSLADSLQSCADWSSTWQMSLASDKCETFRF